MSQHLTLHEEPGQLRRPVIIMAFSGWNDAAESATTAARYLSQVWSSRPLATIDPEDFYHFGLSRPYVRFKPGSRTEREVVWPATEFSVAQPAGLERDIVVGVAIEPHLKWRTYCAAILELARRSRASLVLTLGALLAEVAHTRPVRLVGSSYDAELSARLGLRPSRYEGPTGIVGVLNTLCREASVPTASLWANVPHYVSGIENPRAALALVRRVLTLLDTDADLTDLREAADQFDQNLSSIVAQNAKISEYVRKLERKHPDDEDEAVEAADETETARGTSSAAGDVAGAVEAKDELPPSADLVAEIEQFLRQQQRPENP
jgi:proteasome assembly chaperone (PAC2) family protein